ncbi:sigma-54-dependent Fis family transcriptional regulator [Vibrio alfacsensis]|uniref:Sigma-54-dependent Fis family transcriptional regulator n=1 Tax=Vibrio alfacsensis TaxID=1074311 RepID=A0ABN5PCZ4_9VIBR|nr:sigma-54 dependent transcriptional regulator [Vibrio alfacsensis]AXY01098.1 sigma-54-dependent Fis family transcriptional regulator [Vibrio alfacsensis]
MRPKVLLVEDSNSLAILYQQYVKDEPYDLFHVETGRNAKAFIEQQKPQLVILDLKLPDTTGEEILDWIIEQQFHTAVIIATAHGSVDVAVKLIQKGANDFLEKPIQADRLKTSVQLHLKQAKLENLVTKLETQFDRANFHGFIGSSLPMQAVYKIIESAAPTTASVFIHGESGTGKEVCAEAIHRESARSNKPFVAINCGAIPRDLMESEIFGHVKGAFTGATSDRKGAAMQANGGTLFLDELCEMELDMQKKLLRFLQTGTFTPLGGNRELKVDVRIICATNRDPLEEVAQGRFREDLYYRVHVIPIELPPLRERGKDIATLAKHFVRVYAKQDGKRFNSILPDAEKVIINYDWPGNVRQLQNIMRNIVVLNDGTKVKREHLPAPLNKIAGQKPFISQSPQNMSVNNEPSRSASSQTGAHTAIGASENQRATPTAIGSAAAEIQHGGVESDVVSRISDGANTEPQNLQVKPMWQVERETIQNAIEICNGNVLNAAVLLDLSPSTVYRKKQQWEADDEQIQNEM